MQGSKEEKKTLEVTYRIEPMKTIEITKEHSDRIARARTLAILRSSLFGRKRYQDIYITCSLNNLFNALRIAEFMHRRVPDLAMIITMSPLKIIEVTVDPSKPDNPHHVVTDRKRMEIKLTRQPSQEDRQKPGFNKGFSKADIKEPIEDLNFKREPNQNPRRRRDGEERRSNKSEQRSDQRRDRKKNNSRSDRGERNERRGGDQRPHRDQKESQQRANKNAQRKYRAADDEQLEDDRELRERRAENKKSRGGKTGGSRREQVQTDHEYKREHLNRDMK